MRTCCKYIRLRSIEYTLVRKHEKELWSKKMLEHIEITPTKMSLFERKG